MSQRPLCSRTSVPGRVRQQVGGRTVPQSYYCIRTDGNNIASELEVGCEQGEGEVHRGNSLGQEQPHFTKDGGSHGPTAVLEEAEQMQSSKVEAPVVEALDPHRHFLKMSFLSCTSYFGGTL